MFEINQIYDFYQPYNNYFLYKILLIISISLVYGYPIIHKYYHFYNIKNVSFNQNMCGELILIIGPMFSGKSTELIRRIRELKNNSKKVLVIKPMIDSRYNNNKITSHNNETVESIVLNKLEDITDDELKNYRYVFIDEGQFFDDLHIVKHWVDNLNINITVGGLDGDFQRQPIGTILNLIPHADHCIKLTSMCNICKNENKAPFSFRLVKSSDKVLIGGSESYIPVCRKHFNQLNK